MTKPCVWFSRASSSLHPLLGLLKQPTAGGGLHLLVSHPQWDAPAMCGADEVFLEPDGLQGDAYVDWCLEACRTRSIQLLVPGRARPSISARRAEFEALGTEVLVAADADTLRLLEDKPQFLARIPEDVALVSRYIKVNTVAEFTAAVESFRLEGGTACFKPGKSIFGLGFYVLNDRITPVSRLLDGHANVISLAEACDILGREESFRDVMVMEYLDGVEYSVDCVGQTGELVASVVRMKPKTSVSQDTSQTVGRNEAIEALARRLVARFSLDGLFNMQFRTTSNGGPPRLLEINGRMSGGLALACLAGVNLLELAIALKLGQNEVVAALLAMPVQTVRAQQGFSAFLADRQSLNLQNVPS